MARIAVAEVAFFGVLMVGCGTSGTKVYDTLGMEGIVETGAGNAADAEGVIETAQPPDVTFDIPGPDVCQPNCEGDECGEDGCGGSCGTCAKTDLCVIGQSCVNGLCGGEPVVCDDVPDDCVVPVCVSDTGECVDQPLPDMSDCDDNNKCTIGDTCISGECIGETFQCADDDVCNGAELCIDGTCVPGPPLDCDDESPCTLDACDPTLGCIHEPGPDAQGIPCEGGVCFQGNCCPPQCQEKQCGDDGCGGTCGECPEEEGCTSEGQCTYVTPLVWVALPGGEFQMGCSPGDEKCLDMEKPQHAVLLSPFEIMETEATSSQYQTVMQTIAPCASQIDKPDRPISCISWFQMSEFCDAVGGRLCTEAEWEYAARGNTTTKYYCGDDFSCLEGIAWYYANSGSHAHPVKGKQPNAYGLYDMIGNVGEWTADWWSSHYYWESPYEDPAGPTVGESRVYRGGSYQNVWYFPSSWRVSARLAVWPSDDYLFLGGRCCRDFHGNDR